MFLNAKDISNQLDSLKLNRNLIQSIVPLFNSINLIIYSGSNSIVNDLPTFKNINKDFSF